MPADLLLLLLLSLSMLYYSAYVRDTHTGGTASNMNCVTQFLPLSLT